MTRRALIALPFALPLWGDSARDVWDLLADAASSLSDGNPSGFLDAFDPKMPGYDDLRTDVTALVEEAPPQAERGGITCSIELVSDQGDDKARSLELNWILDIQQRVGGVGATHREQHVKVSVAKKGKKWRIESFDPVSFFAPPTAR